MSTEIQTAVGRFVWHDNISTGPDRAKDFYSQLFGWETEVFGEGTMDYPMIKVGEQNHGGYGKADEGVPSQWTGHVLVEDVDETARKAEGAGGSVVTGPMDIPEVGRFAVIADPQGAVLSVFASYGDAPQSQGVFVWDELVTTDVEAAREFYGEIFGWTYATMDSAMGSEYTIFKRAGNVDTAGAMVRPEGMEAPPHWVVYIGTDDVDATVERATQLGATVFMGGMDISNVGRIAVLQDPVGAVFGLFKPAEA